MSSGLTQKSTSRYSLSLTLSAILSGTRHPSNILSMPVHTLTHRSIITLHMEPETIVCLHRMRMERSLNKRPYFNIQLTSRSILTDFLMELPLDPRNLTQQRQHWMLEVDNSRMDYLLRDVYHNLRGTTVKLSLNAEVMPIVGFFFKVTRPFIISTQMTQPSFISQSSPQ